MISARIEQQENCVLSSVEWMDFRHLSICVRVRIIDCGVAQCNRRRL